MKSKLFGVFCMLFGIVIFQENLLCMSSTYSFIQGVFDGNLPGDSEFKLSGVDTFPDALPSLDIAGATFDYDGYLDLNGGYGIFSKVRYIVYTAKISSDCFVRILISIRLNKEKREAYYAINVDKSVADKIVNAAYILPKELKPEQRGRLRFIFPVDEITGALEGVMANFSPIQNKKSSQ